MIVGTGAYFSYLNYVDYATLAAYNSQTYQAALPLSNLQDHRVSKKARTSGSLANHFALSVDLTPIASGGMPVKVIGLCGMNWPFFTPREAGVTLNFTLNFSNVSIGATDIGQATLTNILDIVPAGMPCNMFIAVNGNTGFTSKFISMDISWTSSGLSFFEAGRLWVGDAIVMPAAIEEGWQQTIQDLSTIQRSRGGQIYSDIRQRYRNTKIEIKQVQRTSIFAPQGINLPNFQSMFLNAGMSSEVLVIPRSNINNSDLESACFMNHTGVYGVFAQKPVISNVSGDIYNLSMELDESL